MGTSSRWLLSDQKQENCYDSSKPLALRLRVLVLTALQFPGWFMTIYSLYQKFMSAKMQNRVLLVGHDLGEQE